MPGTVVLDYGIARPDGLMHALRRAGVDAEVTANPEDLRTAGRVMLPDGDDDDRSLGRGIDPRLLTAVVRAVERGRPLLAIGLGLPLLLGGACHPAMPPGADLFRVPVNHFDPRMVDELERPLKSPHVGYSLVVGLDRHPLLGAVVPAGDPGLWLYFKNRLCAPARVPSAEVAVAHHGVPFAGAIWRDGVTALQFLPELSGPVGVALLRAWDRGTR